MNLILNTVSYYLSIYFILNITKIQCAEASVQVESATQEQTLSKSHVVELEDSTFEKRTQAASGSSSGPWFVKFYAPWCGHCRSMEADWNELATLLYNQVNVAKIDATKHTITAKRFEITSFPTLFFIKDGYLYQYENNNRTAEALKNFALNGYRQVKNKPVPKEWSYQALALFFLRTGYHEATRIYHLAFPGFVTISASSSFVGFLSGLALAFLCNTFCVKKGKGAKKVSSKSD